jgi:hypothetical protein
MPGSIIPKQKHVCLHDFSSEPFGKSLDSSDAFRLESNGRLKTVTITGLSFPGSIGRTKQSEMRWQCQSRFIFSGQILNGLNAPKPIAETGLGGKSATR